MYVKLPGGTMDPAGYIVPCKVLKYQPGWAFILLSGAPPRQNLEWTQWVRDDTLLTDQEAEGDS